MKNCLFTLLTFVLLSPILAQESLRRIVNGQNGISKHLAILDRKQQVPFNPVRARSIFGLDANSDLSVINTATDKLGITHYRYFQTYKGVPVENSMYIAHTKTGLLTAAGGVIVTDFSSRLQASVAARISARHAVESAIQHVRASKYAWEDPGFEKELKKIKGTHATYYPAATKVWYSGEGRINPVNLKLAYKIEVYSLRPFDRKFIYVDAQDGKILGVKPIMMKYDATGTVVTGYSGQQTIHSDFDGASTYRLRDLTKGLGIHTLNGADSYNDYTSNSPTWSDLSGRDRWALDAHFGVSATWTFYKNSFNRNSIDDSGYLLRSYVNDPFVPQNNNGNPVNAFWDGSSMRFGYFDNGNGIVGIDIIGHEFTHGVTQYTSGLIYNKEPGAINESISDIMGKSVQFYTKPYDINWQVSNDINWSLRNMANPNQYGHPDTYKGDYWIDNLECSPVIDNDYCGVHSNSGVGNFMFYLLVNGGSGTNDLGNAYSVSGIGLAKADQIIYRTNTVYLTPTSGYAEWQQSCISAATDLYGASSNEVSQVRNAWFAVGVGAAPCNPPVIVQTSNITDHSAQLNWTALPGVKGYTLQWKPVTAPRWNTVSVDSASFILANLAANTVYIFEVSTECIDGSSVFSEATNFRTTFTFDENARSLYGLTRYGGNNNDGVLFSYTPAGSIYRKLYDFVADSGAGPLGSLAQGSDRKLYGLTVGGGSDNAGVIFSYSPNTGTYTKRYDFNQLNGIYPRGSLVSGSDGKLYGITSNGGSNGLGVLFSYSPSTSIYQKLYDFTSAGGSIPTGSLIQSSDGKLYGVTTDGGNNGVGVIYSFNPSTSTFTKLYDFSLASGHSPMESLLLGADGNLYGQASAGGVSGHGVIFSFSLSTSEYTKLHEFNGRDGANPTGSLIQALDGKLYGMTSSGGANGQGVIFSYSTSANTFTVLNNFDISVNGGVPNSSLVQFSDGNLYGMANQGLLGIPNQTPSGKGVIFSFSITTSVLTMLHEFSGADGAYPQGALIERKPVSAPGIPQNLHAVVTSRTFVDLDWNSLVDNSGVIGYDVYQDGILVKTVSLSHALLEGLSPNTSYTFTVKARNADGNTSAFSSPFTVTTKWTGLNFKYYEGDWTVLPPFDTLPVLLAGNTPNVNISLRPAGVHDHFGFVWEGYINIPSPGMYTFETISDDGSKLYFNHLYSDSHVATVNNDGVHNFKPATGMVNIPAAGLYPISITYFEKDTEENMQVYWSGPGFSRQVIPDAAFTGEPLFLTDSIAPGTPANLHVLAAGDTFIELDWNRSTDNVGIAGYDVYRDDVLTYTTTLSHVTADSLTPGRSYRFKVKARDVAGNASSFSNEVTAATITITGNGLNYKYYEGTWISLPNFSTLTPIRTGITPNVDITLRPAGRLSNFAFTWDGYINLPVPGNYIFETISDDGSRLYLDPLHSTGKTMIVNNNGLHAARSATGAINIPAAGAYRISISYFEKDGEEKMEVYWTRPGVGRERIPDSFFATTPPKPGGLNYRYYEGTWTALPNFNLLTPVKTGTTPNVTLAEKLRADQFGFVWEGYITLPTTGNYVFEIISDDGSKLYFNSLYSPTVTPLVTNDGLHPTRSATGTVNAEAGTYPVIITYFEKEGADLMQLYWTVPGRARELVPDSAFSRGAQPFPGFNMSGASVAGANANDNIQIGKVYPNPFMDMFNVDFYNSSSSNDIKLEIYDLNGRLVYRRDVGSVPVGKITYNVNLRGRQLPWGVYTVGLTINGVRSKMVKLVRGQR